MIDPEEFELAPDGVELIAGLAGIARGPLVIDRYIDSEGITISSFSMIKISSFKGMLSIFVESGYLNLALSPLELDSCLLNRSSNLSLTALILPVPRTLPSAPVGHNIILLSTLISGSMIEACLDNGIKGLKGSWGSKAVGGRLGDRGDRTGEPIRDPRGERGRMVGDAKPTKGLFSGKSGMAYSEGLPNKEAGTFFGEVYVRAGANSGRLERNCAASS